MCTHSFSLLALSLLLPLTLALSSSLWMVVELSALWWGWFKFNRLLLLASREFLSLFCSPALPVHVCSNAFFAHPKTSLQFAPTVVGYCNANTQTDRQTEDDEEEKVEDEDKQRP